MVTALNLIIICFFLVLIFTHIKSHKNEIKLFKLREENIKLEIETNRYYLKEIAKAGGK